MFSPSCFEVEIVCKRPRTQTNQAMAGYMWTNKIYMAYDRLMVPWVDRSYSLARIFCLRTCTSAAAAVAMHSYSPEYDWDGTLDLGYLNFGWQNTIHTRVPQIDQESEFWHFSLTTELLVCKTFMEYFLCLCETKKNLITNRHICHRNQLPLDPQGPCKV